MVILYSMFNLTPIEKLRAWRPPPVDKLNENVDDVSKDGSKERDSSTNPNKRGNTMSIIDIIYDFAGHNREFQVKELRKHLNKKGKIVSNDTITRQLRRLRSEGSFDYDFSNGTYNVYP